MNHWNSLVVLVLFSFMFAELSAQFQVFKLPESIVFDGIVNEEEWSGTSPLDLELHMPVYKGDPTETTIVYLGYDDDYLYLAGKLLYKNVEELRSTTKKRDAMEPSTSYFGLILDTFLDKENGMAFFTTPAGLRFDALVFNDAQGELPVNISWNTFWDVKTEIHDQGWDTEIRIPFSSLRFQDQNGKVLMGMTMYRYISHHNEVVSWPAVPNDLGPWSLWKASRMQEIEFSGIKSAKGTYISESPASLPRIA